MKTNKRTLAIILFTSALIAGCIPTNVVDKQLIVSSIKTVANYGVYFGAKSDNLDETKAKYIEEGLRVVNQLIKNNSTSDFVNIDEVMAKVPEAVKPFIQEAVNIVDSKYVQLKGKISAENLEYVSAIFNGAFEGIESYRKTLSAEATINSGSEVNLATEYIKAKNVLK